MLEKQIHRHLRHKRIRTRLAGTADRPRLSVFRSLHHHYLQLVDDVKGITLVGISDLKIKKKTKKTDLARTLGKELARQALEKGIATCVFDRGGYKYHGRVKAIAEGAREGGLQF